MKNKSRKNKSRNIVIVVVLLLALGGGAFAYNRSQDNKSGNTAQSSSSAQESDGSMASMMAALEGKTGEAFDEEFINQMVLHHSGAIDMATYVDTEAKHSELRNLGSEITSAQTAEIDQMKQWAQDWGYEVREPSEKAVTAMSTSLKGKTGDALDHEFIIAMTGHHTGAIDMASLALNNAKHQEIKDLANEIIDAQTSEITQMQEWAKTWNYSLEGSMQGMDHSNM